MMSRVNTALAELVYISRHISNVDWDPRPVKKLRAFPASFWIYFTFFLAHVKLQLINFTKLNYDRKQERRRKSMSIQLRTIRKLPTPSEYRLTAILNWKSPSQSWDLNPACPVRMPSLYHFCHHHCLFKASLVSSHIGFKFPPWILFFFSFFKILASFRVRSKFRHLDDK